MDDAGDLGPITGGLADQVDPEDGGRQQTGSRRGLRVDIQTIQDSPACGCAGWLMDQLEAAVAGEGIEPYRLMSGAGHDAMALADLTDVGMLFVRCTDGISHNPAEAITERDAATGARVLLRFIRDFSPAGGTH